MKHVLNITKGLLLYIGVLSIAYGISEHNTLPVLLGAVSLGIYNGLTEIR